MRPRYVITTCGKSKYPGPMRADRFYTGAFVAAQGRVATSLKPLSGRLILSNIYGFMKPDFIIPGPYDSHWGYPDTMEDKGLEEQVRSLELHPGDYVVNVGAREYARQTRRLFPEYVRVIWAPKHLPAKGMGHQGKLYKEIAMLGQLPKICDKHCEYLPSEV